MIYLADFSPGLWNNGFDRGLCIQRSFRNLRFLTGSSPTVVPLASLEYTSAKVLGVPVRYQFQTDGLPPFNATFGFVLAWSIRKARARSVSS